MHCLYGGYNLHRFSDALGLVYFGVLRHLQHCAGHSMMGSFVGRGNQYIQLVKVLYSKLSTMGKQLSTFPHKV